MPYGSGETMEKTVLEYIKNTYGCEAEYLWEGDDGAAIRNPHNKKWFAVLMHGISKRKLGIDCDEKVSVLNLKCDPIFSYSVVDNERIFRGYHMNKEHWISILLDGSVPQDELFYLIDLSYNLIDKKGKKIRKK